jgi:two-component system response regulator ChvI
MPDGSGPNLLLYVGGLRFIPRSHRVFWAGQEIKLTLAEYHIVRLLVSEKGRIFTYREVYDQVHGIGFMTGRGPLGYIRSANTMMRHLRRKFYEVDTLFDQIETIPDFKNRARGGYRWRME